MQKSASLNSINILFVSGQPADIAEVKRYLWSSKTLKYHVEHRPDFFGSIDLLNDPNAQIDVILLDLGLFGSDQSRTVFRRMVALAHGIPVIVFTDRADHDMALLAIQDGATDNITRGELGTDIFKFRDAIDFSLARAENSRKLEQKNSDETEQVSTLATNRLRSTERSNVIALDDQKNQYSAVVRSLIDRSDADIARAVSEITEALKQAEFENAIMVAQLKVYEGDAPQPIQEDSP